LLFRSVFSTADSKRNLGEKDFPAQRVFNDDRQCHFTLLDPGWIKLTAGGQGTFGLFKVIDRLFFGIQRNSRGMDASTASLSLSSASVHRVPALRSRYDF